MWVRFLVRKIPWKRAWQPTLVFLPRESHGQRSLVGYRPWGHKESDMAEGQRTHTHKQKDGRKEGKYLPPVLAGCGVIQGLPRSQCSESFRRLPNTVPLSLLLSWNALPSPICLAALQAYCSTIRSLLPTPTLLCGLLGLTCQVALPFLWA